MISEDGKRTAPTPPQYQESPAPQEPGLDKVIQARIGDKLRAMYDSLSEEPVSDRLAEILKRLETGERS